MKKLFPFLLLFASLSVFAQKPVLLSSKEEIIEAAKKEFGSAMEAEGNIKDLRHRTQYQRRVLFRYYSR